MLIPLRVLIVEAQPDDADRLRLELRRAGFEPTWLRVQTKEDYCAKLGPHLQIILSDYAMPQFLESQLAPLFSLHQSLLLLRYRLDELCKKYSLIPLR